MPILLIAALFQLLYRFFVFLQKPFHRCPVGPVLLSPADHDPRKLVRVQNSFFVARILERTQQQVPVFCLHQMGFIAIVIVLIQHQFMEVQVVSVALCLPHHPDDIPYLLDFPHLKRRHAKGAHGIFQSGFQK